MRTISSASTEYVAIVVTSDDDPASAVVEVGFSSTSSEPATWYVAEWVPGTQVSVGGSLRTTCRVLVGPSGDVTLAEGRYAVWTRVAAIPETVVDLAGYLKVY